MDGVNAIPLPAPSPAGLFVAQGRRLLDGRADTLVATLCLSLLGVLMGVAAHRLFAGITVAGMTGVDTFYYWGVANDLLHGHYDSDAHRLSLYAVYALALKILGANDYAIRAFIGGLAVLTHEDLAFLGVGYLIVVALPLSARTTPPGERRHDVARNVGAFVRAPPWRQHA